VNEQYQFGFSEFTTWPWAFRKDLEEYAKQGASVVEICEFKLPYADYAGSLAMLSQYGLRAASVQMQVHSVFVDSMANKPEDPPDRIQAMKDAIEASAPHLPAGTPFIVITGIPPQGNIRKAVDTTVDVLKELGDFAAERNMTIAFEPLSPVNLHKDTAVWYLDQGLDVVERVDHPNVGICVDTWNVWQTPDLSEVIRQCGKRILLVQLSDWKTPRSTADRYSLGDGDIPLREMVAAIRSTGFNGSWVVEILSSMHLEGSLWKSNLEDVLSKNCATFKQLWDETRS
jgi:sugar phosphate isomerase/epimerase